MTDKCVICGQPTDDGRRYCDADADLAQLDPFAAAPINLVLIRRIRRKATGLIADLDQLERRAREPGR